MLFIDSAPGAHPKGVQPIRCTLFACSALQLPAASARTAPDPPGSWNAHGTASQPAQWGCCLALATCTQHRNKEMGLERGAGTPSISQGLWGEDAPATMRAPAPIRAVGWHGAPTALTSRCACPTDTSDGNRALWTVSPAPAHPDHQPQVDLSPSTPTTEGKVSKLKT